MLTTTRTATRPPSGTESHVGANNFSFDSVRIPLSSSGQSCSTSLPSHLHSFSAQDRASMAPSWSSGAPSSSFISDHPSFGGHHQEQADMTSVAAATSAAAARGAVRNGYITRSSTGTLVRNMAMPEQSMMGSSLFTPGSVAQNQVSTTNGGSGGVQRKKRRRYGPKPEPPYMCYCGKVFKRHEHMLRHRATHDDMIKYECPICGKCFRRQDVMHRHTMTHSSRGRLQNKMRATASASSSSLGPMTANPSAAGAAAAAASQNRQAGEEDKMLNANRKREHEHPSMGYTANGNHQEALEDPTLRVGLTEYPPTPTSRHNQDHHIAAAQLYSACNSTRYSYPTYPASAQHLYGGGDGGGMTMAEAGYARSESFDALADYHSRMAPSMSPPPAFFSSATAGFAPNSVMEADPFSMTMGRPHLPVPLSTTALGGGVEYEYDTKPAGPEVGHHYAQSWHGGYSFAHGSAVHMGASESEWSEQSPSGPSTHTFASPAWSQKAELMRREGGGGSVSGGTPLSMLSNRQLSMEPGSRWHAHAQYQQQLQLQQYQQHHHQQQQHQHQQQQHQHQHGSPMFGANSEAGFGGGVERSPAHVTRRRLSGMHGSGSNLVQDGHAHGHSGGAVKVEAHSDAGVGSGMGLGLFDQSHGGHDSSSGSLGFVTTTPTFSNASAVNGAGHNGGTERGGIPPHHASHSSHASPHVSNGMLPSTTTSSSPSHYLGAGMNSMHVSQQNSSYNGESKPGFTSMSSVIEPFDTGSPLTEATGNASPRSRCAGGGGGGGSMHVETSREASADAAIDPHLAAGESNGYVSSSSTASVHAKGHAARRW